MKKLLILAFLLLGCFSMASYAAKPKAKTCSLHRS